jgi:hypothetical protein
LSALANQELMGQWHQEKGMRTFSLRGSDAMSAVMDILVRSVASFADLRRDATMISWFDHYTCCLD